MAALQSQLARDWLSRHITGATPQITLPQLERLYWTKIVGATATAQIPHGQLEKMWLIAEIAARGGTVINYSSYANLWKTLVSAIGQTPTNRLAENKRIFYTFAS